MLGIFTRPFQNLAEADLHDIVEVRKIREHIQLDYKRDPYEHGYEGTKEMLADITAMANAQGGYIIIGVEEDSSQPDGMPKSLVGIDKGDTEANWIQSVCLSSIEEKIAGLQVRDFPLTNGRFCVVIQIPNSIQKPHMIVYQKHRSFRIRHGRDKSYMGVQEVKNMILNMNSYRTSLFRFLEDQKQTVKNFSKGAPWLMFMATPIYVDTEKIDPLRKELRDLMLGVPGNPNPNSEGIFVRNSPQPRIFGTESHWKAEKNERRLRLFRNGHFAYWESYLHSAPNGWPNIPIPVRTYKITEKLMHFLAVAKQILHDSEVNEPLVITVCFINFKPSCLVEQLGHTHTNSDDAFTWEEDELDIELTVNDLSEINEVGKLITDKLFNAFGQPKSIHFNDDGEFIVIR